MPYLLKMAWRNLGRHRGRTALSVLSVTVGVFVVILAKGFVQGMVDTMLDYSINLNSGHLRLIDPEYQSRESLLSLAYPIGEEGKTYTSLIGEIRRMPGVVEAMGRIRFGLLLTSGEDREEAVLGLGTEMESEERIVKLSRFLQGREAGRLPRAGEREILLGEGLMKKLHLDVGDKVNALFSTSFGSFKIATFRVVGRMSSGLKQLDEAVAYLPLDVAMALLDLEDAVTEVVVFGEDPSETANLQGTIASHLGKERIDLTIVPWYRYNELIMMMGKVEAIYSLLYVFIVLLASFVVFNTQLMVVAERTKEIGMLAALGLSPRDLKRLFLLEGGLIAIFGSLAGTLLGGGFTWWTARSGIDTSRIMQEIGQEYLLTPRLYPSISAGDLVFGFALGAIVTVAATYLPARRAAMLRPTEALRTMQ